MGSGRISWHSQPPLAVAEELAVDLTRGLDEHEVTRRREKHGANALPEPPRKSMFLRFVGQFADPLVGALLVAAVVAAAVAATGEEGGSWADTIAILLIVVLNAALGFFQELRAEKALSALRDMAAPRAKVVRNGEVRDIDAAALVPGDLIELEAGDAIPADSRVVRSADLAVEEAALTGESTPVKKSTEAGEDEAAPVSERHSMVFTGTTTTRGRARAVVVATGAETELGRIGAMITSAGRTPTPLEQRLSKLGKIILIACLLISVIVFAIGFLRQTGSVPMLLLIAVSLAVAAIPEGLPAITTITLALGMQRMAARGAIVRKLPAVETLGSATVICSDKTGTLTQNAMTVRVLQTAGHVLDVSGEGYAKGGGFTAQGSEVVDLPPAAERLLLAAALCNTASFDEEGGERRVVGDPTEAALLVVAEKAGLDRAHLLEEYPILREYPFDSDRKRMSVVVREPNGQKTALVKGSPGSIIELSTHVRRDDGVHPLSKDEEERFRAATRDLAGRALRVLAIAERSDPGEDDPEGELTFLGFAAMMDPPRPDARAAVAECHRAGVKVTMITGDHKDTAIAIAEDLNIWEGGALALTGAELAEMDLDALAEIVDQVRVYARVTAEQKLRIVVALEKRGHVVCMTGDGVNDAPALKEAAIGVAMGRSGTDVARQSADMVLADDRFATIVEAIREGRAIFSDIQKFIFFLGSSNAGLVFAVVVLSFFGDVPHLTPLQLLWINLVTNGLPALALGVDPPEPGQMKQGPRPPRSGIVDWRDFWGLVAIGTIMSVAALFTYRLAISNPELFVGATQAERLLEARTMAFLILGLSPLFHAFNCRSPTESIFTVGWFTNRFLWFAIGTSAALQLVTTLVPPLRQIFLTDALTLIQWTIVLGLSILPVPIVELLKLADRARGGARTVR